MNNPLSRSRSRAYSYTYSLVWKRNAKKYTISLLRGLLLFGLCFMILQPLLNKLSISFMSNSDLYDSTVINIPRTGTLDNYKVVGNLLSYSKALFNSVWLTALIAVLQTTAATLVGYGFARFKFPFRRLLFGLVLLTIIIPPQTLLTSIYLNFRYFDIFGLVTIVNGKPINMLNSIAPYLIMVAGCMGLKSGLYVYMLRQFFRGMPKELEEAAYVDGSGAFRTFAVIMLPDALPMLTSCFLFAFVWQWTDTFYSSLFLRNITIIPTALGALAERFAHYYNNVLGFTGIPPAALTQVIISTGTLLCIGPILLIYLFAQKGFIESVSQTGIKA